MTSPILATPTADPQAATLDTPAAQQLTEADIQRLTAEREEQEKQFRAALKGIYGDGFPVADLSDDALQSGSKWRAWADERWLVHTPGVQQMIWNAERNRAFRGGSQYLSRTGQNGQYKEPPQPKDVVRITDNLIRPGLAWALQVMTEQRPGFRFTPFEGDPTRERYAEAKQRAVEYNFDEAKMRGKFKEGAFWCQTDGTAFLLSFWNPNKGPREIIEPGSPKRPLGDPDSQVYRIEQVRVSADATATVRPTYWLLKDIMPQQQAVALYGADVMGEEDSSVLAYQGSQFGTTNPYLLQPLTQSMPVVARYIIFCDRNEYLPNGMCCIIVGNKLVSAPMPLMTSGVPVVRITDGSEDPAFFVKPVMNEIIQPQMRVNMLLSKLYESVRVNAGGRFMSKSGALVTETFIGGQASVIEVRGGGPISDTIQPVQGFSVGEDVKFALSYERKSIEDRDGWSDTARGQFTADQSGRAILAIREQLERSFAPFVMAQADAASEWANLSVEWMKFGYTTPRFVGVMGKNRADLAASITAKDLDGIDKCWVDPETMMPMPRPLKLWLLQDAFEKHVIDAKEYRRRMPFAFMGEFSTPDEAQEAKARRIVMQLMSGQPVEPTVWQDDEAIQQDIIQRDILLSADIPQPVRQAADQKWQSLAQQHQKKSGPPPVDPNSPAGAYQKFINDTTAKVVQQAEFVIKEAVTTLELAAIPGAQPSPDAPMPGSLPGPNAGSGSAPKNGPAGHDGRSAAGKGLAPDPRQAPISGANPSIAAAPLSMQKGGETDQAIAAHVFEHTAAK